MKAGVADDTRPRRRGVTRRPPLRPDGLDLMTGAGAAGVVGAQLISQAVNIPGVRSGAGLLLLQASGPVFVTLFAVILLGAYRGRRGWGAARFWVTSLLVCAVAYVAWSAVYFATDGGWPRPLPAAGSQFAHDLLTGSARPHLGLLYVALQLCTLMPVLRWMTRITRGAHLRVLVVSLVLQLAVSAAVHWLPVQAIEPGGAGDPARLLPSYVFFAVAGALLVEHREELGVWIGRGPGAAMACVAGAIAVAELSYGIDVAWRHLTPARAAQPVQPAVTIAGIAALTALWAVGVWWDARPRPRWQARLVSGWSDGATGMYLMAPLLVQAALAATYLGGLLGRLPHLSELKTIVVELGCGVPVLLVLSWLLTLGLRRSPLSVVLTGRPRLATYRFVGSGQSALDAGAGMSGLLIVLALALVPQLPLRAPAPTAQSQPPAEAPSPTPIAQTITAAAPAAAATIATMHAITVGRLQRTYEVLQPQTPVSTKLPVFVFLHGVNTEITTEEDRDGLLPLVTAGQAILVYPQGFENSWNDGVPGSGANSYGVDDVAFLTDVVHLSATMPGADPALVYVVGYSDGGKMAYDLICRQPRLAAGAMIVAALPVTACPPGPPVTLLQVTSDNDPVNAYQNVLQQAGAWLTRDGCTTSNSTGTYDTLTLQSWATCAQGSRLELATYAGAGHFPFGGNGSPQLGRLMMSFAEHAALTG